MECRGPLIYAQLLSRLDLDEVRQGQVLTVLGGVAVLLLSQLLVLLLR